MRGDAANILIHLGYELDREFDATGLPDGSATVVWRSARPQPTEAELDAAALPAAKARRIADINVECRARLLARYGPAEEQVSRALGIYGSAERDAMEAGIALTIDASNTASDAVDAAQTEAAVEAVTVSWPVI